MGLKVRLAPRAIADLDEIRAYLMERNRRGAERVRQRIEQAIATLADFPGIGRPTHVAGVSVTAVLRYPYLVYYTASAREIVILHIRHAACDLPGRADL
jgi:plasmid stabilization system protein ParE